MQGILLSSIPDEDKENQTGRGKGVITCLKLWGKGG
jgi:hypothetical protein